MKILIFYYYKAINQSFDQLSKENFYSFFDLLLKELNTYAVNLMNDPNSQDLCMSLLINCEKWSIPGLYGCFPTIRVLIYNNFGCLFRKKGSLGIALNYFIKALKLIETSQVQEFNALTHMNMGGLLAQMEELFIFLVHKVILFYFLVLAQ